MTLPNFPLVHLCCVIALLGLGPGARSNLQLAGNELFYVYQYRTFSLEEVDLPVGYLAFKRRNYTNNQRLLAKHIAYLRKNSLEKCAEY